MIYYIIYIYTIGYLNGFANTKYIEVKIYNYYALKYLYLICFFQ